MSIKTLGENVLQQREIDNEAQHDDYYGERGCCLACCPHELTKEDMEGLQRDIWFAGKHYDCICLNCKCTKCSWYFQGECQRKEVMVDEQG